MAHQELEKILSNTPVRDIMTRALITVDPKTTIFQISNLMEKGGVGAILVKKNGKVAGIITDRDFATRVTAHDISRESPVGAVASYPLQTIDQDASILDAAKLLSAKKIRKLAVSNHGDIVGIVTTTDLVDRLAGK